MSFWKKTVEEVVFPYYLRQLSSAAKDRIFIVVWLGTLALGLLVPLEACWLASSIWHQHALGFFNFLASINEPAAAIYFLWFFISVILSGFVIRQRDQI